MMFVGRQDELKLFEAARESARSELIVLYGRRRVGKSELIREFMERSGQQGIYLVGKSAPAALQQRELLREAARVVDDPLLAEQSSGEWRRILSLIVDRWRRFRTDRGGKLLLALDEFQWLVGASSELPSVLQELWDRDWSRSGDVLLILCGSYVGFMERDVLGSKSPLFGRRTAQILLEPFDHRQAAEFHPQWSREEQARAYFLCGGVPFYLLLFDASHSVERNIEEAILAPFSPLFREPDFLLREELRDVENYYAVLLAIADGCGRYREIAKRTEISESSLPYYTQQLLQLGYVQRRQPLSGARAARTSQRFTLADPLLRFWFRFVFPNLSFLSQMGPRRTLRERIRPALDAHFGLCFERLCRAALPSLYEAEGVHAAFEVGEYWDKSVQIDVVGLRDDRWTDLGECKWGTIRSAPAVESELAAAVSRYPNPEGATLCSRIFVRRLPRGRQRDSGAVRWHDLPQLYGD